MTRLPILLAGVLSFLPLSPAEENASEEDPRHAAFRKQLTNARLVGKFTVKGRDTGGGREEEYHIISVDRVPGSDVWVFRARVKYGNKDITLPMPLQVKWADKTPVITLEETTIPGLGTFSTRLVIYDNQYAGIWKHGRNGGQMFGVIKPGEAEEE